MEPTRTLDLEHSMPIFYDEHGGEALARWGHDQRVRTEEARDRSKHLPWRRHSAAIQVLIVSDQERVLDLARRKLPTFWTIFGPVARETQSRVSTGMFDIHFLRDDRLLGHSADAAWLYGSYAYNATRLVQTVQVLTALMHR